MTAIWVLACGIAHGRGGDSNPSMDPDGTLHLPKYSLPESIYVSQEAKRAYIALDSELSNASPLIVEDLMRSLVQQARASYSVRVQRESIGGVPVHVVTPQTGIAAARRALVLINLHGGGGERPPPQLNQLLESIPMAATSGIEVISVDFRLDAFPDASVDVERVYRRLLATYKPQNIGIYGCSFGGILTAEEVAWLERQHLPLPGAIGIFCSGVDWPFGGDSAFYAWPFIGGQPSAAPTPNPPVYEDLPYFHHAPANDPLVSPALSESTLACFPPTLIVTGTRDFMLSSAVHAQSVLSKAGVTVELRVWEGMWHAFFYSVNLPESREMYRVTAEFFDRNLRRRETPSARAACAPDR